jgi:hypothetical protein
MDKTTLTAREAERDAPVPPPVPASPPRVGRAWWRKPWVIPLAVLIVLVAAFLIDELPPYLGLDPAKARITLDEGFRLHYPLLVGHIACGTIALVTLCLQVWPWLRLKHPAVHRISGRLYVFAGVLPSAVMALVITPVAAGGYVGIVTHAVLWVSATLIGWRKMRQRRVIEHRRFMLYSFALTLGILWGRATVLLWPLLPEGTNISMLFEMARWFGWVVNLILVQWWLERTRRRPVRTPVAHVPAARSGNPS